MKSFFQRLKKIFLLSTSATVFFAFPASTNYQLKSFEFGGGGGIGVSNSYSGEAVLGEVAGRESGSNYGLNSGLNFVQQANVPPAPTFTNDSSNRYNKLKIVLNNASNPTDATFAIAISSDNFVTTNIVKTDGTIQTTALTSSNFQTYSAWGGASGSYIIGLSPSTTYKVKVKATQGKYTESEWGPTATAATVGLSLSFDIDIGTTGGGDPGSTAAPYSVAFGTVTPGSVSTASNNVWTRLTTNAEAGGYVYVYDQFAGLRSSNVNYTISSATADLSVASEGFGLQGDSTNTGQTSGGPMTIFSPYDGASSNVGLVSSTVRTIFTTSSSPIVSGKGVFVLKLKASNLAPAASDYADTLTVIAAAGF